MKKCIIDLETIRQLAEEYEEDNWDFRSYVKGWLDWGDEKFDELVHRIAREVSAQIDCTQCANCCTIMGTGVTPEEIERLAPVLGLTPAEFEKQHTEIDLGERTISTCPCPFLKDKLCSVYEQRPYECRGFPHLLKEDVRGRMISVVHNTDCCPIVFNTMERLKKEIPDWRNKRRNPWEEI